MQQLLSEVSVTAPDVGLPDSGDRRKEMVLPRLSNGILILSWIEETCVHVVVETAATHGGAIGMMMMMMMMIMIVNSRSSSSKTFRSCCRQIAKATGAHGLPLRTTTLVQNQRSVRSLDSFSRAFRRQVVHAGDGTGTRGALDLIPRLPRSRPRAFVVATRRRR